MTDELQRTNVDAVLVREDAEGDGRTVELRLVPWDVVTDTPQGRESFARGAFDGVDPTRVTIEAQRHGGPLVGRGLALDQRSDAAYLTARIAPVPAGDELVTLVREGVLRDVSVAFIPQKTRKARGALVRQAVDLRRVAILERGAYPGAEVVAVRGAHTEVETMEDTTTPAPVPTIDQAAVMARLDRMAELLTQRAEVPAAVERELTLHRGEWAQLALGAMSGDVGAQRELIERTVADNLVTGNAGVVPPAYRSELIGIIDASRPFIGSIRRIPAPEFGTKLIMPKLGTRADVGKQTTEKTEVASRAVTTTPVEFDMATYAGVGDVSWQLIRRSSPSFAALFLDLLAEAYAQETEAAAVGAALTGATDGGEGDPADPSTFRGEAVTTVLTEVKRYPDRIWLSPAALAAFLNAKESDTSARSLYPSIGPSNANATAQMGGPIGTIDGVPAIIVPAMTTGFAIGWSGAVAFAEEGTFTLSVDRPDVLGRDTALYGFSWIAPLYPKAIVKFTLPAA
jgi:HK97 family phage major capsid protein